MTPAEHYALAEMMLRKASRSDPQDALVDLATAQVHATLACAQTLGTP